MVNQSILADTPDKLIRGYKKILEENGIKVDKIILFGSYAKGTAKPWSDLDLCIVSKEFGIDHYEETVKLKKLTNKIEPLIEPHPYSPSDLKDPWDPLASEILQTGIVQKV